MRVIAAALLAASLVACASNPAPETNPTGDMSAAAQSAAQEQTAKAMAPTADPADMLGPLSEEAFKALHVLKEGEAPLLPGETVEIAGAQAYLSLPPGAQGPVPGIVLIHEWWGLNDHIRHWADRLAADGYATIAVDLYGGQVATTPDDAMSYMKAVDRDRALEILAAAHTLLVTDPRVLAPTTGSVGWCFGGGWSLQLALNTPELDAAVMYYGRVVDDVAALAPLNAKLLGVFANQDEGIPPAVVDAFDAALTEAGKEHTLLRYDANHAFANPSSQRYNQEAATQAWAEVRAFFAAELKP